MSPKPTFNRQREILNCIQPEKWYLWPKYHKDSLKDLIEHNLTMGWGVLHKSREYTL